MRQNVVKKHRAEIVGLSFFDVESSGLPHVCFLRGNISRMALTSTNDKFTNEQEPESPNELTKKDV